MCLLVGVVGGEFAAASLHGWYAALAAPPGTPPGFVFAPVWTLLHVVLGVAAWRVWRRLGASPPLRLWGWQLALNALWAPVFFGLHSPAGGVLVLAALWPVLLRTIQSFRRVESLAAVLMLPYAAWIGFAGYLAVGFWWLN